MEPAFFSRRASFFPKILNSAPNIITTKTKIAGDSHQWQGSVVARLRNTSSMAEKVLSKSTTLLTRCKMCLYPAQSFSSFLLSEYNLNQNLLNVVGRVFFFL